MSLSIFPRRWFPFEGPQEQVEEVLRAERQMCGRYDPSRIPNCTARYEDAGREIEIEFKNGEIWKHEQRI